MSEDIISERDADNDNIENNSGVPGRTLPAAALRALREADERRRAENAPEHPPEFGGRGGADPARFGDWEINGRAIDF